MAGIRSHKGRCWPHVSEPGQVMGWLASKWGLPETDGCLLGRFLKMAASSLSVSGPEPWKVQRQIERVLSPSYLLLSCVFMGCFSYFKTQLIRLSQCVYFFLGVSTHLLNPYPLSLCTKMERIWSWGQARPGVKPWRSGLCLTFLIWKMGKEWAPPGGIITHEGHLTQCLAHNHWAAA